MRTDFAHQARALPRLLKGDVALAWDPGVGKTRPCLRAGEIIGGPQLVICPAHLRDTWAEAAGLDTPMRSVRVVDATKSSFAPESDISIVSYEYAKTPARWRDLRRPWWSSMVIDEAHYLARGDAARTRAILGDKPGEKYGLVFRSDRVWPISGTFIGGYPDELYPLLRHLFPSSLRSNRRPGCYMDLGEYIDTFCVSTPGPYGEKIVDGRNYPELRERMAPWFDRVKLHEALDMPPLTVDTIPVRGSLRGLTAGLTAEQIAAYKALELVIQDRQIPDGEKLAALFEAEVMMAELRHTIAMVKIGAAEKIIQDELASGIDKILLFGWHREPLRELARRFAGSGLITGGLSHGARRDRLDHFKKSGRILFGQIGAMGSGLNIQVCHRTIFLEASWSTRDNTQAIHRTYRAGQTNPCHASFLSLKGSIDEYVAHILLRKSRIVSKALD